MVCKKDHSQLSSIMSKLPDAQSGVGRHKCAACAYNEGYRLGNSLEKDLDINKVLDGLDYSQAGSQRHKSAHAAFALGYYNGVCDRI